jgi:ELWxxDGT repeat protein
MKRSIIVLPIALWVLTTPTDAYWIKYCNYTTYFSSQTSLVADINPGTADAVGIVFGFSQRNQFMVAFNNALYFQADDGKSGAELWRVAGGAPSQVEDLAGGPQGSGPHAFAVFQNTLYFAASTKPTGEELFKYDGSSISLAAEMTAGPEGGETKALTEYNGALYFTRDSPTAGQQVWRFNGSTAVLVPAINGIAGSVDDWSHTEQPFVVFKNRLYFVKETPLPEHYELWAYDGSAVTKIKALTGGQNIVSYGFHLGVFKDALYFGVVVPAVDPFDQDELWRYTGQGAAIKVATLPGNAFSFSQPGHFQTYKQKLYFRAGSGFFRFDGSMLQDLFAGTGGTPYYPREMSSFPAADKIYLTGFENEWISTEPYTFDGSSAYVLKDIMPATATPYTGSFPTDAVDVGGTLYFYAKDDTHGRELWQATAKGIPMLECYIVVAPIWEDWRQWPVDRREVVMATWLVGPGTQSRLVSREVVTVSRGSEARLRVLGIDTHRESVPEGFALATLVFDRETGSIVDRGFDVAGTPTPRAAAALKRSAARLLKARTLKQVMAEPVKP